jgi:Tfp pilus assembly protein PilO
MLLLLQTAPTPAPLPPPSFLDAPTAEAIMILTIIAVSVAAFFLLKPLVLALARRLEGRSADPALHGEVEHLRDQIAELEPLRGRLQELEERVEFAERLLAQRRDQDLLPRGGQS